MVLTYDFSTANEEVSDFYDATADPADSGLYSFMPITDKYHQIDYVNNRMYVARVFTSDVLTLESSDAGVTIFDLTTGDDLDFWVIPWVNHARLQEFMLIPGTDWVWILYRQLDGTHKAAVYHRDTGSAVTAFTTINNDSDDYTASIVPVTSGANTKHYVIRIHGPQDAPATVNRWSVHEIDTDGSITARVDDSTTMPFTDISRVWSWRSNDDGSARIYAVEHEGNDIYTADFPYTWAGIPTFTSVVTLVSGELLYTPYYHSPLEYLLVNIQVDGTQDVIRAYDVNTWTQKWEINAYPHASDNTAIWPKLYAPNVSSSAGQRKLEDQLADDRVLYWDDRGITGFLSELWYVICIYSNTASITPIEMDLTYTSVEEDVEVLSKSAFDTPDISRGYTYTFGLVPDDGFNMHRVYRFNLTTDICEVLLTGISFGEEKDPNYVDFGSI